MTHIAWVLTEERPAADGGVHLVLTAVPGAHPRVRHRLDADGVLRAGLSSGSIEDVLAQGEDAITDVADGERRELDLPASRAVAEMPTPDGLAAAQRLQRGAALVWEAVQRDTEVRGVHDVEVDGSTSVVLPLLRHTMRRIAVTDDDRLLVLDEHAAQTRPSSAPTESDDVSSDDVSAVVIALWRRPADVTSSRIHVHARDTVRSAYVDGRWQVTATSADERLVLSLPIDFPAERFGDA